MKFSGTVFDQAVSVFLDNLPDYGFVDNFLLVAMEEMMRTLKL